MAKETITTTKTTERNPESELEFKQWMSRVHHSLKEKIGPDFIFAKLSEKDQEYITETTHNAYYSVRLIKQLKTDATKWKWIENKQTWQKIGLTKEEKEQIEIHEENIFQTFMTRVFMTITLNINKPNNDHVRLMAGAENKTEEENNNTDNQMKNWAEKIADKIRGE